MNRSPDYLLRISLILLIFNCCRQAGEGETVTLSDLPPVQIPAALDSVIGIRSWLAIGPFEFNPRTTDPALSFLKDDLKRYGIKEGLIDGKAVEKLQRRGINTFLINESSPKIQLFNYVAGNKEKKSHFYLVARIHSVKAQDAILIFDGSNSYALWLNGDKLVEERGKYNTNKTGDRFVNITLHEGENLLFLKINRSSNLRSWDLICAIASCREGERIFKVNYAGDFVVNPIVTDSFEVYAGPYPGGKVEVLDVENRVVAGGSFDRQHTNGTPFAVSNLGGLADGFYKVILMAGDAKLEETVYKGNYNEFVEQVKASVAAIDDGSPYARDLTVAMERVNFLNSRPGDPKSPSETRYLNRNRVFWGYSLFRMLAGDASTKLMTCQDEDSNQGVFIFHAAKNLTQNIPPVFIIPFALEGESMVEDWYTSNLDQIEADNALADHYGLATVWIYAGGRNYSAVRAAKEIAAILKRLQSEYGIDDRKLFILGDSEGGRRALIQLAATPDRYAACVVTAPLTLSGGNDGIPVSLLPQMGKIPLLIRHGTGDDVSPVEHSRRFYAEAQKYNLPVEYIENEDSHVYINRDYRRFAFEFFCKIAQNDE